jgi:hypothetical protein
MVLMSMETYKRNMARADLFSRIAEGEDDVRKGNLIDYNSALKSLKEEFFETEV